MIYLDANASAPLLPQAREAMQRALAVEQANPSSLHWAGQAARAQLDDARERCAAALSAHPREIVFTSGGTESDALAILGALRAARATDPARRLRMLVTAVEHPAVRGAAEQAQALGAEVVRIDVDANGALDWEALETQLGQPGTLLCSAMAANNETGVIFPVARIAAACRARGVLLHVDAVQAAGKLPLDDWAPHADLLSVAAHKLGGPLGIGLLRVRTGVKLAAWLSGGQQERGRRAGTENPVAAAGFAAALEHALDAQADCAARWLPLRDQLERACLGIPGSRVLGSASPRVANTLCAVFAGCDGETLCAGLDLAGIAASTGSACSSGTLQPSPVLLAMGLSPQQARGALRLSLWAGSTAADVEATCAALPRVVAQARSVAASS